MKRKTTEEKPIKVKHLTQIKPRVPTISKSLVWNLQGHPQMMSLLRIHQQNRLNLTLILSCDPRRNPAANSKKDMSQWNLGVSTCFSSFHSCVVEWGDTGAQVRALLPQCTIQHGQFSQLLLLVVIEGFILKRTEPKGLIMSKAVVKNPKGGLSFIPQASNNLLISPQPDSDGHQSYPLAIQLPPASVVAHLGAHTQVYLSVFLPKESRIRSVVRKRKARQFLQNYMLKNQVHPIVVNFVSDTLPFWLLSEMFWRIQILVIHLGKI